MRLREAADMFGLAVGGLRREAARGRLAIFRVSGKDFTTAAEMQRMFEQCRFPNARWPNTASDDWCGEFVALQPDGGGK